MNDLNTYLCLEINHTRLTLQRLKYQFSFVQCSLLFLLCFVFCSFVFMVPDISENKRQKVKKTTS